MFHSILQTEVETENLPLTIRERAEHFLHHCFQLLTHQRFLGLEGIQILQHGTQGIFIAVTGKYIQGAHIRRQAEQLLHLRNGHTHLLRNFFGGGVRSILLLQKVPGRFHLANSFRSVQRNPYDAAVVHQAAGNALANPLGGISGKAIFFCIVKFPGGNKQSDTALLNQVHQRHAPSGVFPSDINHKAEISVHHLADGSLIPGCAALGQIPLLLRCEPGDTPDFIQILMEVVIQCGFRHPFNGFSHVLSPLRASSCFR